MERHVHDLCNAISIMHEVQYNCVICHICVLCTGERFRSGEKNVVSRVPRIMHLSRHDLIISLPRSK